MTRAGRWLWPVLGGALSGCWVDKPVYVAAAQARDDGPGTHVVASGAPPAPERMSEADRGLVVLQAPVARRDARQTIRRFFDAIAHESQGELEALLASDAILHAGPGSGSQVVSRAWAARFERLDYEPSGGRRVFREDELELYEAHELTQLSPPRRFSLTPRSDQLLAVVNVRDRRTPGEPRRFGPRIEFIVDYAQSRARIREVFEDFRLP